jgi:HEAT repeat protein
VNRCPFAPSYLEKTESLWPLDARRTFSVLPRISSSALYDNLPDVRSLAASKLAFAREKDTIPFILAALARESIPVAKIGFASAAAELGVQDGFAALRSMCGGPAWSRVRRMNAANMMVALHNEDCLSDVLDILKSRDESQIVDEGAISALCVLLRHSHVPAQELPEIRRLAAAYLRSDNDATRVYASDVLARFGDLSSADDLRRAFPIEHDENVQVAITNALKALETKPGQ